MPASPIEWSDSARAFLTHLQFNAAQRLGVEADTFMHFEPEVAAKVAKWSHEFATGLSSYSGILEYIEKKYHTDSTPTPFEFPVFYLMIVGYAERLERAVKQLNRKLPFNALLGTLVSGRLNAMAVSVPRTNEFLILFELGLFGYLNLMSKLFSRLLLGEVSQGRAELSTKGPVNTTVEDVERFVDALSAYLLAGHPMGAKQYFPDAKSAMLHGQFIEAIELFVMGHEYGHVTEGHFDQQNMLRLALGEAEANECLRSWQQEIVADVRGLELSMVACQENGIDVRLAFAGATTFFTCARLLEWSSLVLRWGTDWEAKLLQKIDGIAAAFEEEHFSDAILGSHPPSTIRRQKLVEVFSASVPENLAQQAIALADRTEEIADELWSKAYPVFLRMHTDGLRPSEIWD